MHRPGIILGLIIFSGVHLYSTEVDVIGELVLVRGEVTLSDNSEGIQPEAGVALADGDTIQTNSEGCVEITLGNQNQLLISSKSKVLFDLS